MILVPTDQSGFPDKHAQDRPLLAQCGRSANCTFWLCARSSFLFDHYQATLMAHYQQRHSFAEDGDCLEGEGPAARGCAAHSDEA
jgi:hypothetical protein